MSDVRGLDPKLVSQPEVFRQELLMLEVPDELHTARAILWKDGRIRNCVRYDIPWFGSTIPHFYFGIKGTLQSFQGKLMVCYGTVVREVYLNGQARMSIHLEPAMIKRKTQIHLVVVGNHYEVPDSHQVLDEFPLPLEMRGRILMLRELNDF